MPNPNPHLFAVDLSTPDGLRGALHAALGKRWCNILARRTGCDQSLVSHVVRGYRKNGKVQRAIARVLQRPVAELFPPRAEEAA